MISKIFAVYSTRYGWINAIKFIQFCEDFKISNFVQKFSRSHLDLLYREYQAKICGKGGGELDLEGFAYVLLMLARKKQSRYKTRSILQVWLELIAHLYATQKTAQRRRKCMLVNDVGSKGKLEGDEFNQSVRPVIRHVIIGAEKLER